MLSDLKRRTTETYDQICDCFLERNSDRTRTAAAMGRFTPHLRRGGLVLDMGCGPGFDAALLRDRGFRVVGVELSGEMVRMGKRNFPGTFVRGDMEHPPFGTVADGLWVNASFLHVERSLASQTLEGFRRLLKPGGVLFLGVKEGTGEGWERGRYESSLPRWFTYWQAPDLERSLLEAGFSILDLWSDGSWVKVCAAAPPLPYTETTAARP